MKGSVGKGEGRGGAGVGEEGRLHDTTGVGRLPLASGPLLLS